MSSNWIRAFCVNTSPSTYTRKEQTYCPPLRDVQQEPRVTGGGRILCADQMCDQHYLSQERTQEVATKTGAAVTSGGTEGLLPLCVSGQKTRTMFKEKGKAKHPARTQEAQEEAGPSGSGRLLLLLGTCPQALPNFSASMFNPRKTEEPDHKATDACRGMESGHLRGQPGTCGDGQEREGRPRPPPGEHPTLLPSRWAGPGRRQRDTAQEPLC